MTKKQKNSKSELPMWYFVIQGRILTVRADSRVLAFKKARAQLGMAL